MPNDLMTDLCELASGVPDAMRRARSIASRAHGRIEELERRFETLMEALREAAEKADAPFEWR